MAQTFACANPEKCPTKTKTHKSPREAQKCAQTTRAASANRHVGAPPVMPSGLSPLVGHVPMSVITQYAEDDREYALMQMADLVVAASPEKLSDADVVRRAQAALDYSTGGRNMHHDDGSLYDAIIFTEDAQDSEEFLAGLRESGAISDSESVRIRKSLRADEYGNRLDDGGLDIYVTDKDYQEFEAFAWPRTDEDDGVWISYNG